jgi:hypothetical protein
MYQKRISEILQSIGRADINPRHIEAYMRLEHSTLDGLSSVKFRKEVIFCSQVIDYDGIENAESCAKSFGL